jgi:hypothetical protein
MATMSARAKTILAAIAMAIFWAGAFDCGQVSAASVSAPDWTTRPKISDRVLLMQPDEVAGAVILLPGGHGNINLDSQAHVGWGDDDFLVRTRMRYATNGLVAIIPDVPADYKPPASLVGFRTSQASADDLHALSDRLRQMAAKVWLVAYDTGATSALNAFARGNADSIAGLVLVSPILEQPDPNSALLIDGIKLALSHVPVLIVGHEFDECSAPTVDRIKNAAAAVRAPNFQSITVTGGSEQYSLSDPFEYTEHSCQTQAHHLLAGRDAVVSQQIIDWIGRQGAAPK